MWLDGASRPQPPQMQPVLQHAALGGLQGHRRARHLRLLQPSPRNRLCQPHVAQPGLQAAWSHVHGLRDPWRPEEDAGGKRTESCAASGTCKPGLHNPIRHPPVSTHTSGAVSGWDAQTGTGHGWRDKRSWTVDSQGLHTSYTCVYTAGSGLFCPVAGTGFLKLTLSTRTRKAASNHTLVFLKSTSCSLSVLIFL